MSTGMTKRQYAAVRAFERFIGISTDGWAEAEGADAHWDGGEWSGPAWTDNWENEHHRVAGIVAARFGMTVEDLLIYIECKENDEENRWYEINHIGADAPGNAVRPGIDHDPVKPWNWATIVGQTDPVEIVSYPDEDDRVFVRMVVGDPTSAKWVPLSSIAAFSPDRHEWRADPVYAAQYAHAAGYPE